MYPFLLIANYALLSLTFVISKQVVALAHPLIVVSLRMIAAGSLLLGFTALRNRAQLNIKKADLGLFLKTAFFHIYLAFLAEFWALQYLPSAHVNMIYSFTPLCSASLSYLINKEILSFGKLCALGLGLIGLSPTFFTDHLLGPGPFDKVRLMAEAALLVAVFSSTYAWFDISRLMKSHSIVLINGLSMLIGGIGALLTSFIALDPHDFTIAQPQSLVLHIASLIILSNILFYNLFGALLKHYSLNLLTFSGLLSPLFGAVWGKILLGEEVNSHFLFTLGCLFIALLLFFKEEKKAKRT